MFNNSFFKIKKKVIKLPNKPQHVRVVHGDCVDSLDIDYQAYDDLVELRVAIMAVFEYFGWGEVNSHFGSNHFAILINDKEVLRVADVAYVVGDDEWP